MLPWRKRAYTSSTVSSFFINYHPPGSKRKSYLSQSLYLRLTNVFSKGQDCKDFSLCRTDPLSQLRNSAIVAWKHPQTMPEQTWMCSNEPLSMDAEIGISHNFHVTKYYFSFDFISNHWKMKPFLSSQAVQKQGGRLDSVCGCSFSNPSLHPEPWFLPTCPSPSSEQPRTQSSNAQCKSEKTRRHKELRLNSLVAGSVIIHFLYACACMCMCVHGGATEPVLDTLNSQCLPDI